MDIRVLEEFRNVTISGLTLVEALNRIEWFHGALAPGIVLGGIMIDLARQHLDESVLFLAVTESRYCLPDAVQLFTPCTLGNNWLQVMDYGRFAVTLYDKNTGEGIRVWIDLNKLESFPEVRDWFLKRVSKKDLPQEILVPAMLRAGTKPFSTKRVRVSNSIRPPKKGRVTVCPQCGESYPESHGSVCRACGKGTYFVER